VARTSEAKVLEVCNLVKEFGGLRAVDGVSFTLAAHTITGLIGPNGAGKTTLFDTIAGMHRPTSGTIVFLGRRIGGLPPHRIFAAGLVRTFQIPRPFAGMTVLENLMLVPPGQSCPTQHAVLVALAALSVACGGAPQRPEGRAEANPNMPDRVQPPPPRWPRPRWRAGPRRVPRPAWTRCSPTPTAWLRAT
jgi:ABC-type Fe3+/spermidine/putrescine transport system ATPase subunit